MTDSLITVRAAMPSDLTYIDHLQRKNAEDLSFYPTAVFDREIIQQRIVLALVNDEPAGYLYHGSTNGQTMRIHQACIQYDLRGYLYGAALVNWLIDLARAGNVGEIALRCGSDIAANGFWQTMGFECQSVTQGGARRMRDINAWRLPIQEQLFSLAMAPSTKQKSASAWAKARKDGISLGSSFKRGKDLAAYRTVIESNNERITP
jgi:GNAT superfamily N-acetyltransferase